MFVYLLHYSTKKARPRIVNYFEKLKKLQLLIKKGLLRNIVISSPVNLPNDFWFVKLAAMTFFHMTMTLG